MTVRYGNNMVVFGGQDLNHEQLSHHVIWVYNLYTEQWERYEIPDHKKAPPRVKEPFAVTVGTCIYMFAGRGMAFTNIKNTLWKLTRTHGYFQWSKVVYQSGLKRPSPRCDHRGWEYGGCLWIFGGYGRPFDGYLSENGTFTVDDQSSLGEGVNNQLLCYDPSTQIWTNPQCYGSVPSPRSEYGSTVIKDNVWLFGGYNENYGHHDDLFQIDMYSRTWTLIESGNIKPHCVRVSLTAISETELVLVDDQWEGSRSRCYGSDIWILDLTRQTWKQYTSHRDHPRCYNTVVSGVNRSAVITGGMNYRDQHGSSYTSTYHVMLEPKSLQQLAMKTIYNQRSVLPWKHLPTKLIAELGLLET